jgi:hypothetical protein
VVFCVGRAFGAITRSEIVFSKKYLNRFDEVPRDAKNKFSRRMDGVLINGWLFYKIKNPSPENFYL